VGLGGGEIMNHLWHVVIVSHAHTHFTRFRNRTALALFSNTHVSMLHSALDRDYIKY